MFFSDDPDPLDDLDPESNDHETDDEEADEEEPSVTQRVIAWLWFFFKLGFALSVLFIIIVAGALFGIVKGFSERIPIVSDRSYRPSLTSQVFDCKGRLMARLHAEENRTRILSANEIPLQMRQAVIAIEDERFYQHYGIDFVGIARAMVKNIQAGKVVQGASTLTQQLVKNAFLTSEKTLKRKAIEAMMAFQLERKYSKEEILTLYLNEIYFGHGAYGLDAAARLYFNKDPMELTLLECATLAGIPKSPVAFSPRKNPQANKARRELVLAKMVELGFISPADYEAARNQPLVLAPEKPEVMLAPYFVTYVRDILLERYGANLVYNGGLKIYTTLDLDWQKYAEEAMDNSEIFQKRPLSKDPLMSGSLVCLDPHNGHIKAMYGGRDFEKSQFNRVTQALRQPGSSFKPFVYGCALENGALPNDFIVDEPISYTNPWSKKVWAPKNYDLKFHGTVTLTKALCNSFNIPAVKLIDQLTPAKVIRFARKLGITAQMEPNLSLALGSGNFTPLEMASAYGVFANQGIYAPPVAITRVEDRDGNILEESLPRVKEVMKAVHATMIADMLRVAVEKGTGRRAIIPGRSIAGKTGTTNNYVDAWFNGFTPELVTIVQFGYDMPKSLGPKMAGGTVAAPVWHAFMSKVLKDLPPSDFPVPEGAVRVGLCMSSGKLSCKSCPGETVVKMTFPIESVPRQECPFHGSGARVRGDENEGAEFAADRAGGGAGDAAMTDFAPDPDFFQVDYRRPVAAGAAAPASRGTGPQPPPAVVVSADAPDGLDDDALANAEAVEEDEPVIVTPREPGVVMRGPTEFRETY
ncbi:MAG: Multimodular transpeptidase-transglycosylase [Candidatus Ozemobacter sibiricus]|jgi:penicillin-binding protein 1A|uniref:Multimodular transpeptidase-transglycosylase n=1 Tax=Candidatus Ozemobacter sibiricus TaxID=2268124 RepID=A0A367ZWR7_9BACT|nr:MAG: Multimodular transpeptidase-transglycosylase [Candidatus Ozemobacter sibiricus]